MSSPPSPRGRQCRGSRIARRGFTLLEVILSLAIMAASLAALGELARLGMRNAIGTRDLTRAQVLCESKLAEMAIGAIVAEPVQNAPFENDPDWSYSVEISETGNVGLVAARITIRQNTTVGTPIEFSAARWVTDPNYEPPVDAPAATPAASSSGSSPSSTPAGSGSGTGASGTGGSGVKQPVELGGSNTGTTDDSQTGGPGRGRGR